MARVLVVGIDPDAVDYADPALPPGMTAVGVRAAIARGLAQVRDAGHEVDHLHLRPDADAIAVLRAALAGQRPDCVAVGGGLRLPPQHLALFEAVLNAVARTVPPPAIALPSRPDEIAAAVGRVLPQSGQP